MTDEAVDSTPSDEDEAAIRAEQQAEADCELLGRMPFGEINALAEELAHSSEVYGNNKPLFDEAGHLFIACKRLDHSADRVKGEAEDVARKMTSLAETFTNLDRFTDSPVNPLGELLATSSRSPARLSTRGGRCSTGC